MFLSSWGKKTKVNLLLWDVKQVRLSQNEASIISWEFKMPQNYSTFWKMNRSWTEMSYPALRQVKTRKSSGLLENI
jgi:hypothetical protein